MKAIVITHPGAPEVLQIQDRPKPIPKAGEVLVKVEAAGVNRPDVAQRKGIIRRQQVLRLTYLGWRLRALLLSLEPV